MSRAKRTRLNQTERMAALMLEIKRGDGKPIVSRAEAKTLTPQQIIDLFTKRTRDDHIAPVAVSKNNHVSNRQLIAIEDHDAKTSVDIPQIAKTKRIEKEHAEFRQRLLAKTGQEAPEPVPRKVSKGRKLSGGRLKSRPLAGTKRSGLRKRMDGRVEKW